MYKYQPQIRYPYMYNYSMIFLPGEICDYKKEASQFQQIPAGKH